MKFLLTLIASIFASLISFGQTFSYNGLNYNVNGPIVEVGLNPSASGIVVIPDTVTYLGTTYSVSSVVNNAFQFCSALTSITLPNSVTSIGASAFSGCSSLTLITLPNSVTSIGNDVFQNCTALTSISVPNSVTSIGFGAFSNCISLTSITLSNSITSIEQITFSGCNSLTSITIPNSVTNIGNYAFQFCSALTSITIPNSVTSIGFGAFTSDTALTSIAIPNSLTSIQGATFFGCNSLTSITIPNSVTSIGDNAFSNCTALTSTTIPNSVTSIGDNAFSHCTELTSLTIPNSVTSIGIQAFYSCSSLASIFLPSSLTSIGDYAFSYNNALTLVVLDIPSPLSITSSVFQGQTLSNIGLCVPIGSLSAYQSALIWQDFNPISEGVNVIPIFDTVPTYCSGAIIPPLPTTSTNGVLGTWSPAINSNATTTYTFTPTSGCATATLTITILPNSTTASLTNTGLATTSTCAGTLEAAMIGGTAPFSYMFNSNPPQDSSTLNNACAGFNYVTITDAVGCSADASYFLPYDTSSQPLTAFVLVTSASQTGVCDGEAEVFVASGTAPYTFVHSTGGTSSYISGLCEGVYSVTVTDALGATVSLPYMVAPDTNTLFIYQDDTSNAYNTTPIGAIENCNIDYSAIDSVTVASVTSFAVDSVTVIWNVYSGGGALEVIPVNYYIGFGLGYYNFILDVYCPTKSNGKFLKVTAKVNVSSLVSINEEVNFITGVYPNPFTGNLTVSLANENQYSLSLYDISGRILFSKKYDNTNLIELSDFDYLTKGEYLLQVQSAEGVLVRKVVK